MIIRINRTVPFAVPFVTRQAGLLARRAGAKRISVFHFSPKYEGAGDLLIEEAMGAFNGRES